MTTKCKCGIFGNNIQLINNTPYSHNHKHFQRIVAYKSLNIYDQLLEWIMSYLFNYNIEKQTTYLLNKNTNEVYLFCHMIDYEFVNVGKFNQLDEVLYIYMNDNSYIRISK